MQDVSGPIPGYGRAFQPAEALPAGGFGGGLAARRGVLAPAAEAAKIWNRGFTCFAKRTGSFSIPAGGSWAGKEALFVLRGWKSRAGIGARAQMDNVSLISSTIPEPASMATMILGLAGALALRRRMR